VPRTVAPDGRAAERKRLIQEIEDLRSSRVITYVLSDRQGAAAQVADDAVRPLYDHLRAIGHSPRIDLLVYSTGGFTDIPWRIVTMIREYTDDFGVLVPYRAMSAATMIALGADEIVMGPKGELGPIDPQLGIQRGREGETPVQEQLAVEDIMSYLRLLRDKVGLTDQAAISGPVAVLAEKLDPWILGQANRAHSHIRDVARKLLTARRQGAALDEQRVSGIIEMLAEKVYQHGHAIGRKEASSMGLNVVSAEDELESAMWRLLEEYEGLCETRDQIDTWGAMGADVDQVRLPVVLGAIESGFGAHRFAAEVHLTRQRQIPPGLNVNFQLGLNLPAGFQAGLIPEETQQIIQNLLAQVQQQVPQLLQEELRRQVPTVGIQGRIQPDGWRPVEGWDSL